MTTDEHSPEADETTDTAVAEASDAGASTEEAPFKLTLQVDIQDAGSCRKHVNVTVSRSDLDHYYADVMGELESSAEVKGFRVGHVPRKLLAKRFRKEMTDQVKQKVLLDSLEQLEAEDKLDPINQPDIDIESLEIPDEGDFEYSFEVEVRPEFDLPDYKGVDHQNDRLVKSPRRILMNTKAGSCPNSAVTKNTMVPPKTGTFSAWTASSFSTGNHFAA